MVQVSPGVVVNEFDFSDYVERTTTTVCGMVGWATRGPIDIPTLITNERQLVETFGRPGAARAETALDPAFDGVAQKRAGGVVTSAIQFLREGNQLYVVRVADGSAAAAQVSFGSELIFTATTKGTWANSSTANPSSGRDVKIQIGTSTLGTGYFKVSIQESGVVREVYDNVTTSGDSAGSTDADNLIETRINQISKYVSVSDLGAGNPTINDTIFTGMTGGDDGDDALAAGDFIGVAVDPITKSATGLQALADPDTLSINILACPGVYEEINSPDTTRSVEKEMISICETRGDAFALLDPPIDTLEAQDAIDFVNGNPATYSGGAFDSSYAGFYWPWTLVADGYNGENVWIPPSAFVSGAIAKTGRINDPWWAPAGLNRGDLTRALNVVHSATLGEREQLYSTAVNPLVNFPANGIVIWGQKTTQRKASALNRVNVRLMLNFAKVIIAGSTRFLLFEPNDSFTWRRFVNLVNPPLEQIKTRRGLIDFKVICDETTNTPDLIDQNIMRGIILMKPTKTAEVITIDFTLLSTGAQFNEFIEGA